MAFAPEDVARFLARNLVNDPEEEVDEALLKQCWPVTASAIATSLHILLEERRKEWETMR